MKYIRIKKLVEQEIQSELKLPYSLPKITNSYTSDKLFRLFYVLEMTLFMIDLEIDEQINRSNLMIFGPQDFGPYDLSIRNIKKGIQQIKEYIHHQFTIEYYQDMERLGVVIFQSPKDLAEDEINTWMNSAFQDNFFQDLSNSSHPLGYTGINRIITQYPYNGEIKQYRKVNNCFRNTCEDKKPMTDRME